MSSLACCCCSGWEGKDCSAELEVAKDLGSRQVGYMRRLRGPAEFPWSWGGAMAVSRFVSLFGWSSFVWSSSHVGVIWWVDTLSFHDDWRPQELLEEISSSEGVTGWWQEDANNASDLRASCRFTDTRSWQWHCKLQERQLRFLVGSSVAMELWE